MSEPAADIAPDLSTLIDTAEESAFNRSTITQRSPTDHSSTSHAANQEHVATRKHTSVPSGRPSIKFKATVKMLICKTCKIMDSEKKLTCPNCSTFHHIDCIPLSELETVREGSWLCPQCVVIVIEDTADSKQNPNKEKNRKHTEARSIASSSTKSHRSNAAAKSKTSHSIMTTGPSTKPPTKLSVDFASAAPDSEQIGVQTRSATTEAATKVFSNALPRKDLSVEDISTILPELDSQSTKIVLKPSSTKSSKRSSRSSKLSTSEKLRMIDEERETQLRKMAAQAAYKEMVAENERKLREAKLEQERQWRAIEANVKALEDQIATEDRKAEEVCEHLASEETYLRNRREAFETGSRRGSSLTSATESEKNRSIVSWINNHVEEEEDLSQDHRSRANVAFISNPPQRVDLSRQRKNMAPHLNTEPPRTITRDGVRRDTHRSDRDRSVPTRVDPDRRQTRQDTVIPPRTQPKQNQLNSSAPWLDFNATTAEFIDSTISLNSSLARELNLTNSQIQARHVIPKEIPPFAGDPMHWPQFISAFANTTRQCGFTDEENIARLNKCLKGQAYEAVRTDLLLPSSLPTALSTLRMLFGRPQLIFEAAMERIRNTPPVKLERLETIVTFSLRVKSFCDVVRMSRMDDYLRNPSLLNELVDKLPPMLKMEWGRHRRLMEKSDPAIGIEIFEQWLRENAETASCLSSHPVGLTSSVPTTKSGASKTTNLFYAAHEAIEDEERESSTTAEDKSQQAGCAFCKMTDHKPSKCDKFLNMAVEGRWAMTRDCRRCIGCFGNHLVRFCRTRKRCGIDGCEKPHNPLLHNPEIWEASKRSVTKTEHKEIPKTDASSKSGHTSGSVLLNAHSKETTFRAFYQVVPVTLFGKAGRVEKTYAFLDSGSTVTLMEQEIADRLGLEGAQENLTLKWTSDVTRCEPSSQRVSLRITGPGPEVYTLKNVRTARNLGLPCQAVTESEIKRYQHLQTLTLPLHEEVKPTILIGLDNHQLLTHIDVVEGEWTAPTAVRTRLGWSLLGGAQTALSTHCDVNFHREDDQRLHEVVKDFFRLESLGVKVPAQPVETKDDTRAKRILVETVRQAPDGRYEAGLLWRSDNIKLPPSRQMAVKRHMSFERRLAKDTVLAKAVDDQIADYLKKGYMIKLEPQEALKQTDRTWYLPIFAVKNPNKPAKTRLVWDAAASVDGTALNTHLLTGPDFLCSLVGVLLRFREHPVAIGGDIRQMFHQIRIRPEDQNSQRCLWRHKGQSEISTYKMTVMTFGAACSPSTAQYVKNHHASQYQQQHPRAVDAIHNRHYVDDYVDSFATEDECIKTATAVTMIHQEGGFELRNFVSNSPEVMRLMTGKSEEVEKSIGDKDPSTTILGMHWSTGTDTLCFRVNAERIGYEFLDAVKTPTKREVLRILMMVFDPLGLLGFYILQGKLVLKEVWRTGVEWDDSLQEIQAAKWAEWVRSLRMIESAEVPRCYFYGSAATAYEMHTFVDASEHAAAAVVYIVGICTDVRTVAFAMCKTKIAPNKAISIPRMELQAAVMGARLATTVQDQQSFVISQRYFWSDSRNVLCWIRMPRTFKPFVALRIGEILESTDSHEWRWVPTAENVADEATKWKITPRYNIPNNWFQGPEFLHTAEYPLERGATSLPTDEELEVRCLLIRTEEPSETLTPDFHRFRKLRTLLRVQVRVLRVFNRYRRTFDIIMTAEELEEARLHLIRSVQIEAFGDAWYVVKNGQPVPRNSPLYTLSPFMDTQSIIRMRSRLRNAEYLTYEQRCPIILPRTHPFTDILIVSVHERYYHQNLGTVLNELRQQYFIPRLRRQLQSVKKSCQRCKIRDTRPEVPEMADLPHSRTAARMRPFTFVGVDYFGPMTVKVGRRVEKRWGAIFTCLTVRAVHLEIASSLSADTFLLMLRAFIARRGIPREVFCDNGTNFRGAEAELKKLLRVNIAQEVQDHFADITWKFNPPAAPHMGGAWERLIRSIKNGLSYALPDRNPSDELLRCCLYEIEAMVNSRPLTYVETEAENLEAITPNHFLLGSSSGVKPYGSFTDDVHVLRKEWQRHQRITNTFWNRWVSEYLPTISQRTRWYDVVTPLKVGDVVAVVLSDKPYSWQLGRIIAVTKSKDGSVRQAEVKTANGIIRRPASKLAILIKEKDELSDTVDSSTGGSVTNGSLLSSQHNN